jgi:hypothetical protein
VCRRVRSGSSSPRGVEPGCELFRVIRRAQTIIGTGVKRRDSGLGIVEGKENEHRRAGRGPAQRTTRRSRLVRDSQDDVWLEHAHEPERSLALLHGQHIVSFASQQAHEVRLWPAVNQQDPHRARARRRPAVLLQLFKAHRTKIVQTAECGTWKGWDFAEQRTPLRPASQRWAWIGPTLRGISALLQPLPRLAGDHVCCIRTVPPRAPRPG